MVVSQFGLYIECWVLELNSGDYGYVESQKGTSVFGHLHPSMVLIHGYLW